MPSPTSRPPKRAKKSATSEVRRPASTSPRVEPEFLQMGDGRCRVVIEGVAPEINAGRYPIKRVPGEKVVVEADVFADGHDSLSVVLKFRHESGTGWLETAMEPLGNDRWRGEFNGHGAGRVSLHD